MSSDNEDPRLSTLETEMRPIDFQLFQSILSSLEGEGGIPELSYHLGGITCLACQYEGTTTEEVLDEIRKTLMELIAVKEFKKKLARGESPSPSSALFTTLN